MAYRFIRTNEIESRELNLLQIHNKIYLVRDSISLLYELQIYNNKIHVVRDSIHILYELQIYNNIHVVRHLISLLYELQADI